MSRDLDVTSMDYGVWDLVMSVVLRGNMLGCKHVIPSIVTGGGSIILTTSVKGRHGQQRPHRVLGREGRAGSARAHGRHRIRASWHPVQRDRAGIIATPGLRETVGEEYVASLLAAQLVPRLGTAEDVAAAVVYLASAASSFMTAQTLVTDGGLTAYVPVMSPRAGAVPQDNA